MAYTYRTRTDMNRNELYVQAGNVPAWLIIQANGATYPSHMILHKGNRRRKEKERNRKGQTQTQTQTQSTYTCSRLKTFGALHPSM